MRGIPCYVSLQKTLCTSSHARFVWVLLLLLPLWYTTARAHASEQNEMPSPNNTAPLNALMLTLQKNLQTNLAALLQLQETNTALQQKLTLLSQLSQQQEKELQTLSHELKITLQSLAQSNQQLTDTNVINQHNAEAYQKEIDAATFSATMGWMTAGITAAVCIGYIIYTTVKE